ESMVHSPPFSLLQAGISTCPLLTAAHLACAAEGQEPPPRLKASRRNISALAGDLADTARVHPVARLMPNPSRSSGTGACAAACGAFRPCGPARSGAGTTWLGAPLSGLERNE